MEASWTTIGEGLTAEELEREYSPSSCLPDGDYGPFIAAYRARSAAAWAGVEQRTDVTTLRFRSGPTDEWAIDIAVPQCETPPPIVVFIHGGYWQELSSSDSRFAAEACVERGWAFAAIDYPLAPHASIDEIVAACREAIGELASEATNAGFDGERIVVAGSSAGAHLAAMVALAPTIQVAGTVLVSGVFELAPLLGTSVNDAVGMDLDAATRNSPVRQLVEAFPSTIVAYGSNETEQFKVQSHVFAAQLAEVGTLVECFEVVERNHFDVILDLVEPATMLGDAVASLIDSTDPNKRGILDAND